MVSLSSPTADLVEGAWGEVAVAMARKIALSNSETVTGIVEQ